MNERHFEFLLKTITKGASLFSEDRRIGLCGQQPTNPDPEKPGTLKKLATQHRPTEKQLSLVCYHVSGVAAYPATPQKVEQVRTPLKRLRGGPLPNHPLNGKGRVQPPSVYHC